MSDFAHGTNMINEQLLNMLQYIKNCHHDTSRTINNYKAIINTFLLVSPSFIYNNLKAYMIHAPNNTMQLIFDKNDNALLGILNGLKGGSSDVDDVIRFIMMMWNDRLTNEQKEDVWKFIHLIVKIYTRLQTIQIPLVDGQTV